MTSVATQTTGDQEVVAKSEANLPPDPSKPTSSGTAGTGQGTETASIPPRPKQFIKLGRFDGRTDVDAFIWKFTICVKNNGWTDEEKLNQLMCALVEPASQILWESDAGTLNTWSDLVQRLRTRYGSADQAAQYQTQLSTRKQRVGEELGSVVQDVRRLMTLAYPGATTAHSELYSVTAFIDALADNTLASKVREREPKSLDDSYKVAMRLDGYRKAEEDTEKHEARRSGRVNAVGEDESARKALLRRMEQLERKIRSMAARKTGDGYSAPTNCQDYGSRWNNCGRTGPFAGQQMENGYGGRLNRLYYDCQSPEHLARYCPLRL